MKLTEAQRDLLTELRETDDRGAFCMACDGQSRSTAHEIERLGFAEWRGSSWGSQHWSITPAGRAALEQEGNRTNER